MPDGRPPFDLLKACFWLLVAVIGCALTVILITVVGCTVGVLSGRYPAGTCQNLGINQIIRDTWSEILTAVLALLAVRPRDPPPPPPPD